MIQQALIVESTRLHREILEKIFNSAGIKTRVFSTGKEALEAEHGNYTFILAARTLDDISGEVFLQKFTIQHGLGEALTILLTTEEVSGVLLEANKAGFKLVFNKNNIESLQHLILRVLNTRILEPNSNILFVEDSKAIGDLVASLFAKNKGNVTHVERISEMHQAFDINEYDLVITDYHLHDGETGDDVINYIRNYQHPEKSQTPILVVSSESNQLKRTAFLRNGANDFIIKPYDDDELIVRAANLIKGFRLIKQTAKQQQQLLKMALTDQLTGLYNRHSLNDVAPKYISTAKRHNNPLSILVIDLDHFKKINDTKGHSIGDIVLQSVATVLQNMCRTEDIVARFGGEEFVMLLSNCNLQNAIQKAETIRKAIEESKPEELTVTSSIGTAELGKDDDFANLFDKADKAVYKAKETGRNKVVAG